MPSLNEILPCVFNVIQGVDLLKATDIGPSIKDVLLKANILDVGQIRLLKVGLQEEARLNRYAESHSPSIGSKKITPERAGIVLWVEQHLLL